MVPTSKSLPAVCLVVLVAYAAGWSDAQATTYPATVEFDVVFPRNDTYSPVELMPLVFAVQNPRAAGSALSLSIEWTVAKIGSLEGPRDSGLIDLTWANTTTSSGDSDPYYAVASTHLLNSTTGAFSLLWTLSAGNCSNGSSSSSTAGGPPGFASSDNVVGFTLQDGAQQPDLVAAAGSDACATMPNQTFDVSGTLPMGDAAAGGGGRNSCAVLAAAPSPSADPCALGLSSAQAASISATMTASACAGSQPIITDGCPQATGQASAAASRGGAGEMGRVVVSVGAVALLLSVVLVNVF